MSEITPGPWPVSYDKAVVNIPHRGPGCVAATYCGSAENARLVSASPNLLKAVGAFLERFDDNSARADTDYVAGLMREAFALATTPARNTSQIGEG